MGSSSSPFLVQLDHKWVTVRCNARCLGCWVLPSITYNLWLLGGIHYSRSACETFCRLSHSSERIKLYLFFNIAECSSHPFHFSQSVESLILKSKEGWNVETWLKSSWEDSKLLFLRNKRLTERQSGTNPDEVETHSLPLSHESLHDHTWEWMWFTATHSSCVTAPDGRRSFPSESSNKETIRPAGGGDIVFLVLMCLCGRLAPVVLFTLLLSLNHWAPTHRLWQGHNL